MKIRLNKVQKELNLGLSTIVEFLQKKGIEIKEDPNAVVPEEGYQMLIEEFSADKKARMQSDSFTQERKNKEKPKAAPVVEEKPVAVETPKTLEAPQVNAPVKETPKKEELTIKITGKIDLDALNRKSQPKKKEEQKPAKAEVKPAVAEKPEVEVKPVEEKPVQPVVKEAEVTTSSETQQAQLTQVEEVAPKLNIIGQIDLSAINQSTRPKKKSKEEKKKEREEKDKQREEQRKARQEAMLKQIEEQQKQQEALAKANESKTIVAQQPTKVAAPATPAQSQALINNADRYCVVIASLTSRAQAEKFIASTGNRNLQILEKDGKFRVYAATGATYNQALAIARNNGLLSRYNGTWVCKK